MIRNRNFFPALISLVSSFSMCRDLVFKIVFDSCKDIVGNLSDK